MQNFHINVKIGIVALIHSLLHEQNPEAKIILTVKLNKLVDKAQPNQSFSVLNRHSIFF